MRTTGVFTLAALVGAPAAVSAQAYGVSDLSYIARSTMVTTLDPSLPIYAAPPGVGYDGVAGLLITKPTGTFLCTGSLVGATHSLVVTAAHCLLDATSVDAVFFPPGGGSLIYTTTSYTIKPGYTGAVIDPNDIGVIDLGTRVDEVESYAFFTGDPVGEVYNEVGFGRSGTGLTGDVLAAGLRRQGYNRFDFTGADPIWSGFWSDYDILFADFDNGEPAHDASCLLTAYFTASNSAYCDLGLGDYEALGAPGDSGGPLFIGGRLAAISSFGLTFADGIVGDIDGALNATFGEFAGLVPIGPHLSWLESETVPEPMTILLMATGLLVMGGAGLVRRRRVVEG
jgi:hypothetical protein